MMTVETKNAPAAIGPYSQAKVIGNLVYTSGQIPLDPAGKKVDNFIEFQTIQACENIKAILEAAGSSLDKVIKTTCYLRKMTDFAAFNKIYEKYFTSMPARSCVEVSRLPKDVDVEIEAIAYIKEES